MTRRHAVPIEKQPVTWILVADGRQAQIYARRKTEKQLPLAGRFRHPRFQEVITHEPMPVEGMEWKAESADHYELGRDKNGTVFESVGAARHRSEPHIEVREEIREHLAETVAERLNRAHEEKTFDRLVLVAPPKMLGEIKKRLNEKVLKRIAAEMPKDLTHYDGEALAEHLGHIA